MALGDAPHGQHDHATTEPGIRQILAGLGLAASGLRWIESYSHSAWMTDDVVVRYRIIGPTGRLAHEAAVATLCPKEALYPEVVAHGQQDENDWLVTARVPGDSLLVVWPRLNTTQREAATHELAAAVQALHGAPARHLQPPCLFGGAPLIPRSAFIDTLAHIARDAPGDDAVRNSVLDLLDEHRGAIDDYDEPKVMAHHDLNFGQCVWHQGHVVALLDLEMAHANTADWDLVVLLGMCTEPRTGAPTDAEPHMRAEDFALVPRWFREAYPGPSAHPRLAERLRVYRLIYGLAELMENPDLQQMSEVLEQS